ncbi:patatin-like phospholipase family protein [Tateyamaria omphalii]|uniref:patatin-like phospholipase family protein n=1 Tax=Tateyamaria omphalii TaxID=299262 RepID=UPI001C99607F|nr:patatin-like phospholipase family protein [Tateyamaria omphalii]MBY5932455.1 patatin-like phospholipase family protein [Tateyamaria omphalii]
MTRKKINVALQGGGAHGAFTWGALDVLLADDRIEIAGVSGTSAGALNGAAIKAGLAFGGEDAARENLDWLWAQVAGVQDMRIATWMAPFGPAQISQALEYSLPYAIGDAVGRMVSPYTYGPFYRNPLTDIVSKFNMDKVCCDDGPQLFINATRVRNGKLRVFGQAEVTPDVIMASACLPTLFQAVVIHDTETGQEEEFWDGGYTGNPALFPLFDASLPNDIVVININPLERDHLPRTPQQIQNRINEISFNSSLLREMRAIAFVKRLIDEGTIKEGQMRRINMHMIADDALMNDLSVATKVVPNGFVMGRLRDAGARAAQHFLDTHFDQIGRCDTIDMREMFG